MSRFIRFRDARLRSQLLRSRLPSPLPPRAPAPRPPTPGTPWHRVTVALKFLSILVSLVSLLLTLFLARSGHDTAGLVAVLSALAPLLVVVVRSR